MATEKPENIVAYQAGKSDDISVAGDHLKPDLVAVPDAGRSKAEHRVALLPAPGGRIGSSMPTPKSNPSSTK